MADERSSNKAEYHGLFLGLVGVVIFGLTLPLTRMAVAELDPFFIAFGRAVVAALLAAAVLLIVRPPWPARSDYMQLARYSLGVVVGFPLFATLAMTSASAAHGGWQTISWALVFSAPVMVVLLVLLDVEVNRTATLRAWLGFAYVSAFSMYLGFFAWNLGLALGGIARVGQLLLLQTFVTLAASALLLGERVGRLELGFALIVAVWVALGWRAQIGSR